jgi:spermidine synthase
MRSRTWSAAALLFGSGFCALVYQTGWLREFRLIFGASTAASAAVLAIFIGGLGAGGLWLGPRADRHARPLLFYATLEAIVAVSAALSPFLLMAARTVYLASGGSPQLGTTAATILRLVLSTLVLAVPTVAMGGTLPAAARAVTRATDTRRQDLAVLYSINTLGAVAGCLLSTFVLLEVFGTRQTLWLAAAINLLVAMVARQMDRTWSSESSASGESRGFATPAPPDLPDPRDLPAPPGTAAPQGFLLAASATVGFAFFLLEIVWYRLLAPLLGGSVFTFGLVLAIALVGIGVGGLLYALVSDDRPATLAGFATSCLLEAAAVAATYALGDRLAVLALVLLPLRAAGFAAHIGGWTIVATLAVLPPAIVAGYQFPLLIALFGRGRERLGREIGLAYAANTAGAIAGSLAGGFGVLPWLSAPGAWRLSAVLLLALGASATILNVERRARGARREEMARRALRSTWVATALVGATILLLMAHGPSPVWRHSGIGAGRAPLDVLTAPNKLRDWSQSMKRAVVWDGDGTESGVALALEQTGYAFVVNGKSDGSARGDAGTQVMLGLLGVIANPQARRALVVGLGTGSTAGWLAAIPAMERVDVVELEPLVVDVARACRDVNHDAMDNPKVHLTIGDARETLLTTGDRYDVIASEPSNPFRAGIASLFTQEFYRAATDRLTDDGVFAQWVQGYEIDARTLRTIYATMGSVFPHVETWQTSRGDLVLLGARKARVYQPAALAARIAEEPFKTAIANVWRAVDLRGVLAHYVANDSLTRTIAQTPNLDVNTDDRNIVEFGLARSVGRAGSLIVLELRQLAEVTGAAHPAFLSDPGIDWSTVATARVSYYMGQGWFGDLSPQGSPVEQARQRALMRYYENGEVAGTRDAWRQQPGSDPRDPTELAMVANFEADAGSDAALPLIERMRAQSKIESDVTLAALRLRQSNLDGATAALESAFTALREDPWPALRFKQGALGIATTLGAKDPGAARRLFEALHEPFSVRSVDESRMLTAAELATRLDFAALCRQPVAGLEPFAPWNEGFLRMRRQCYGATNDPGLARATLDLEEFLSREPLPLAVR